MKYIKEFDSLRAFAVIAVMFQHFFGQFPALSVLGSAGVTLFFVLSGYLITSILLKEKEHFDIDCYQNRKKIGPVLRIFYIRRSLRIFPIYYITLTLLLVLNIDNAREFWNYHFFYASNFLYSFEIDLDGLAHFWSLAVEEQFYLVWPFMILLVPRNYLNILFFSILILASVVFKIVMIKVYPQSDGWYLLMPACVESFAFGAMVILVSKKEVKTGYLKLCSIASLLLFGLLEFFVIKYHVLGSLNFMAVCLSRTVFSLFSASVLLLLIKEIEKGRHYTVLNNKYLMLIGKISYGVYIYHHFVPDLLGWLQQKAGISLAGTGLQIVANFGVSFLIAYLSFKFIETPVNNLKNRFAYK